MLLFLVRHAATAITGVKLTGRLPGFDLSAAGREQARATGERLAQAPLKAIYSSPLERCTQTAEAIARHHRIAVRTLEQLSEVDYGDWQGRTMKALYATKSWKQLKARPADFRFPRGETIREAQTRGMRATEGLRAKHRGKAVVVCSHADMVRLLVAGYLGLSIDLYDRITIAPASITTLSLEQDPPRLLSLGDAGTYRELFADLKAVAQEPSTAGRTA